MPAWSLNNSIRTPLLLLAIVESLVVYFSVLGTGVLLFGSIEQCENALGPLNLKAAIVATMILISLVSMGLYHFHQRIYFREVLVRVTVGIAIGALGLAAIYFAFPAVSLPRDFTAIVVLISLVVVLIVRFHFINHVDTNIFRRRTLVYGTGERAKSISALRRRADRRGFKIVGSVPVSGNSENAGNSNPGTQDRTLLSIAHELEVDEIVIAVDDRRGNLPVRDLLDCKLAGVDIIDLLEFLERESGKVRIDLVNPSWLIFSSGFRTSKYRRVVKRLFDVAFSCTAFLIMWPLLVLIALAIKIEDGKRSPVLYRQYRVGHKGTVFPILKFRSMVENAEGNSGAVWAEENDSRITRVGKYLRKSRADEIPQLINVFRGEMSIVGPRPERPEFVEGLAKSIPYYLERHTVKPGITGWAQLRYAYGSSEEDTIQKLQYDLFYVKNQSVMFDVTILLQTLEVVLWGKGSR